MAQQWYYERDRQKCGPVTDQQLRELVEAGQIQPADTIWKDGVEQGMPAYRVKNLYPPEEFPDAAAEASEFALEPAAPAEPSKPAVRPEQHARKARATAIRGCVITGQDGSHVQFRRKCVVCGHENPNKIRLPIKTGMNRVSFFCTKCKKVRTAEFQGMQ